MNYSWNAIKYHIARKLSEATGSEVGVNELVAPPKPELGDVAFGCFALAKALGKSPVDVAKELEAELGKGDHAIESMKAAGPYLNITVKTGDLISRVIKDVEQYGKEYGCCDVGGGKQVMVEYAQPNTHKEIHIGHLRNLTLGLALCNLLRSAGWNVVAASYHGDVGAHVSKCLWLLVRQGVGGDDVIANLDVKQADDILAAIPKEKRTGRTLGSLYAEATKLLDENEEWKAQVSHVQQRLEAKDPAWNRIWQETRRWSVVEMMETFAELGIKIDRQYFESEVVDRGQQIVDDLLAKGVAKMSQGAVIVDLEADKLGVFLIRKSDGTSLYATKDLALAFLKLSEYPKLERSLHVVDNRQLLYFKQLFRTLKLMGVTQQLEFVGYEFLTLKSGAMSSREGNVVTYETFRDEVVSYATQETLKRHPEWNDGRVEHAAWALAMGGIKYGMLKQDSDKIITFDLEKSMAFEGDTGPYVQYAVTRMRSILAKAGVGATCWVAQQEEGKIAEAREGDATLLAEPAEKALALKIAAFPEACDQAARELRPSVVAQWCFGMAQTANAFYRDVPVLDAPTGVKQARLRLVAAAANVLAKGLETLGIPVPDEM